MTLRTDSHDDLRACVAEMRALLAELAAVNNDLLAVIDQQRSDYEALLGLCADAGSQTAALVLTRLRAARAEVEADA